MTTHDAGSPGSAPPVPARTLAGLIAQLGAGEPTWDQRFARQVAGALSDHADRIALAPVEALQLDDVVVTFHLGERLQVVVTGTRADLPGELTLRWRARDLVDVGVSLAGRAGHRPPYVVCSLDFTVAGRRGELTQPVGPVPSGQTVRVRARATIGRREEWRVQALGRALSVPIDGLRLAPAPDDVADKAGDAST